MESVAHGEANKDQKAIGVSYAGSCRSERGVK